MRLIDADALRAELTKWRDNDPYEKERCVLERWIRKIGINVLIRLLMDFPTIEAEPVRHGRWEEYPDWAHLRCTNCKIEFVKWKMPDTRKRCPNCGANMRGDTDE